MISNKNFRRGLLASLSVMMFFGITAPAYGLEIKDAAVEVRNDFVLEPAKTEVFLKPGDKVTKTLSVVNRTDREQTFTIDVEDFGGSRDPKQVVVLLGSDRGPYSLKDYIRPEVDTFKLKSKQRAVLQVVIAVPTDAEPGGHYGSVLVSSAPSGSEEEASDNKARTVSRIGSLYFVRVAGKIKEDGKLTDFHTAGKKSFYEQAPIDFELLFENNSSVHLTPNGYIEIKNMLGRKVGKVEVAPFFSLPDSLRGTEVSWSSGFAFGRYTATAHINRGYKESADVEDTMSIAFWVLPWKIVVGLLIVIVIAYFVFRKVMSSFEIKRRK
jgi:hypothetical protein